MFVTLRPIDYTICNITIFTEFVLMIWAWNTNLFFLLEYTFFYSSHNLFYFSVPCASIV